MEFLRAGQERKGFGTDLTRYAEKWISEQAFEDITGMGIVRGEKSVVMRKYGEIIDVVADLAREIGERRFVGGRC